MGKVSCCAVALDFQTNLTGMMIANATVITGFRFYPHIDMAETGCRAGETLIRSLSDEFPSVMLWYFLPMLTLMLCQTPLVQPIKDIMGCALRNSPVGNEAGHPGQPSDYAQCASDNCRAGAAWMVADTSYCGSRIC